MSRPKLSLLYATIFFSFDNSFVYIRALYCVATPSFAGV